MSRAVVLNTITKLNDLLDQEEGKDKMIGGGRRQKPKQAPKKRGGAMIPYGSGLVSYPAPFGMGQYIGGAQNPWVLFLKQYAARNGIPYSQAMLDPNARAEYHASTGRGGAYIYG